MKRAIEFIACMLLLVTVALGVGVSPAQATDFECTIPNRPCNVVLQSFDQLFLEVTQPGELCVRYFDERPGSTVMVARIGRFPVPDQPINPEETIQTIYPSLFPELGSIENQGGFAPSAVQTTVELCR